MYSANGAMPMPGGGASASDAQPARLGATTDVLLYKPEYLKALIAREPWPQHGQSGRLGEGISGHHGLLGLRSKA